MSDLVVCDSSMETWSQIGLVAVICSLCYAAVHAINQSFNRSHREGATALLGAALASYFGYALAGWPWGAAVGFTIGAVWREGPKGVRRMWRALVSRMTGKIYPESGAAPCAKCGHVPGTEVKP